ncbi:hypothetical protein BJX70DRAFT_390846 [Aspergillus crustosus]
MAEQKSPFDLPGLHLPVDYKPEISFVCVNALDSGDIPAGLCGYIFTLRELAMIQIMEMVTDKPDWYRKEILQTGQDVTPAMMNYMFDELRWKAEQYNKSGPKLQAAVRPLEDVPEDKKDYHPRSDNKVVDLVHPSLFPLIYGRTRVLRDTVIGVDDCFSAIGHGIPLDIPDTAAPRYRWQIPAAYSNKFQWLPSNMEFTADGACHIASYINNLHPAKHRELYAVIEEVLTKSIPLWNIRLNRPLGLPRRLPPIRRVFRSRPPVDLREKFRDQGLQVIVKLANIELTPERPEYAGGAWAYRGSCASSASHQTTATTPTAPDFTQGLGSVSTPSGRLLTFPNPLQHRVSPFELRDRSKPGHRKILALFLIDPNRSVVSTANVPPPAGGLKGLPVELQQMVQKETDFVPMTMDEAREVRLELMDERSVQSERGNTVYESGGVLVL